MKTPKNGHLTKLDLASRWGHDGIALTIRQVERIIRKFNLAPCDFHGRQPEFHPADVAGMEERRKRQRLDASQPAGVITVKEAKRRAGKGGAK